MDKLELLKQHLEKKTREEILNDWKRVTKNKIDSPLITEVFQELLPPKIRINKTRNVEVKSSVAPCKYDDNIPYAYFEAA